MTVSPSSTTEHVDAALRECGPDADACLTAARSAMQCEAVAISKAAHRLDGTIFSAVDLIARGSNRVVISGVGKSGLIGRKIAATLTSIGTPASFLHPTEALHGDLGVCTPGDVAILLSNSGATAELLQLVPFLRQRGCPLIGILGERNSPMAQAVDVVLDASVDQEADPCAIVPTASTAVAMALGDAIASGLMALRRVTTADFGRLHPGGKLGRDLNLAVADVMHRGAQVAWVTKDHSLKHVVIEMTRHPLGAALVVDEKERLQGLITDGDIRRALEKHDEIRDIRALDVMTRRPSTVGPNATLREALVLMEDRSSQISVLPVVDSAGRSLGLLRVHDLYAPTGAPPTACEPVR